MDLEARAEAEEVRAERTPVIAVTAQAEVVEAVSGTRAAIGERITIQVGAGIKAGKRNRRLGAIQRRPHKSPSLLSLPLSISFPALSTPT